MGRKRDPNVQRIDELLAEELYVNGKTITEAQTNPTIYGMVCRRLPLGSLIDKAVHNYLWARQRKWVTKKDKRDSVHQLERFVDPDNSIVSRRGRHIYMPYDRVAQDRDLEIFAIRDAFNTAKSMLVKKAAIPDEVLEETIDWLDIIEEELTS